MRRKEFVEQKKNRRKNSIINPTDDIETSGESSFGDQEKIFTTWVKLFFKDNETEKVEEKEVISIAAAGSPIKIDKNNSRIDSKIGFLHVCYLFQQMLLK